MIRLNKHNHKNLLAKSKMLSLNGRIWFVKNCTYHVNHHRYHISTNIEDSCSATSTEYCDCYYLAPEFATDSYLASILVPENEIEESMLILGCTNEYKAL